MGKMGEKKSTELTPPFKSRTHSQVTHPLLRQCLTPSMREGYHDSIAFSRAYIFSAVVVTIRFQYGLWRSAEATFLFFVCSLTLPNVAQSLEPSTSSLYHIWGYLRIRGLCVYNSSSGMFLPFPSSLIPKSVSSARRLLLQNVFVTI